MPYRGPNATPIRGQFNTIQGWAGEACTWRQYISAASAAGSGIYAGGGVTRYYVEHTITGLFAAPQMGEARFRETQVAGGQIMAGDMVASTFKPLEKQDELIWRGVYYRIEGDSTPIHIGGRLWYRTLITRGDITG